jgi:quinol monooxygenase YgiN
MVHRESEVHPVQLAEYFCVATYLPVRSFASVVPFLRLSSSIERQLHESEGSVRYAVRTDIPRKHFWTLSVWTSREAMRAFVGKEPHLTAIRKFGSWAGEGAAFAEYSSKTGAIDWEEATRQMLKPTRYFKA